MVTGKARADLDGGGVAINGKTDASPGGNRLLENEPADLINETQIPLPAMHKQWDHVTASSVLTMDVRGAAGVEPIAGK